MDLHYKISQIQPDIENVLLFIIRGVSTRNNYNIVGDYPEDYSAKDFKSRPEIKKMMDYCRKHPNSVDEILFLRWDRYSRNLEYALTNIRQLKKLGITVNAIENFLDHNSPDFPTMLGVYIGNAEAENNKISRRTKECTVAHLEKGRCVNKAPRGYRNVRINDKLKYVEVVEKDAETIQKLFQEVAKGVETPCYIRRQFIRKGLKLSMSHYYRLLRNRFYVGEVFVPEFNEKPAHYVQGQHEPIIQIDTFNAVQDVLDGKRKNTPKLSKKIHPDAFLRGYLKCPICEGTITGAESSGRGGKYYYYNCSRNPKHFRCRADEAIKNFTRFIAGLKPNTEVLNLYHEILCDLKGKKDGERKAEAINLEANLSVATQRLHNMEDMYIDKKITEESYLNIQQRYNTEINDLKNKIAFLKDSRQSNLEPKLGYSINLINRMDSYISAAKVEVKCKLLGSIFPQKITYDGKTYRTTNYNSVLDLIYKQTNTLRGVENKNGKNFNTLSADVPGAGIEPAQALLPTGF